MDDSNNKVYLITEHANWIDHMGYEQWSSEGVLICEDLETAKSVIEKLDEKKRKSDSKADFSYTFREIQFFKKNQKLLDTV